MTDRGDPATVALVPSPPTRLPLAGELPRATTTVGGAVAAKGFRPFFLLAGVFAVALVPLWLAALQGWFDPGSYLGAMAWHGHEMVFGFAVAVIAGFLLTAAGNWTQRETAVGGALLALAGLWLAGRFAVLGATALPRGLPAVVDLAFLPALAVALGRPIVAARNRRNYVMLAVVAALWLANLTVHLDALGVLPGWRTRGNLLGVDVVIFVIVVMAGRIFPMFTRNATKVDSIRAIPALEIASVAAAALLLVLDLARPDAKVTALVAGATGCILAARTWCWGARHSLRIPLVWILHAGYAWIPIGLLLRAIAAYSSAVLPMLATHALTVGAVGGLTLGMMSRTSLGPTGPPLPSSAPWCLCSSPSAGDTAKPWQCCPSPSGRCCRRPIDTR